MDDGLAILLVAIIAFVLIVAAVFYLLWILLVVILKVLAVVVVLFAIGFFIAFSVGVISGCAVPIRVLWGHSSVQPEIASPDLVVAGEVFHQRAPRGLARHFGWDRAWPLYIPYQGRRDMRAIHGETKRQMIAFAAWSAAVRDHGPEEIGKTHLIIIGLRNMLFWILVLLPLVIAFSAGLVMSVGVWTVVMLILGGGIWFLQFVVTSAYSLFEKIKRRLVHASSACPFCYAEYSNPVYKCSSCQEIHADISPGALGIVQRLCGCGAVLPTTVTHASNVLESVCPSCRATLPSGAGTRMTLRIPVFGAISAGKTRLVSAALVEAERALVKEKGSVEALTPEANSVLQTARSVIFSRTTTAKTPSQEKPNGTPLIFLDARGKQLEVHFVDVAGERFVTSDSGSALSYFDVAKTMIFVLDPLALPRVFDDLYVSGGIQDEIASSDQEDAYQSVAQRLRDAGISLGRRRLGVVLSKLDLLRRTGAGVSIDPSSSQSVRSWLVETGIEGLVRTFESDFKEVVYFAVDSLNVQDEWSRTSPIAVLDWLFSAEGSPVSLLPAVEFSNKLPATPVSNSR